MEYDRYKHWTKYDWYLAELEYAEWRRTHPRGAE